MVITSTYLGPVCSTSSSLLVYTGIITDFNKICECTTVEPIIILATITTYICTTTTTTITTTISTTPTAATSTFITTSCFTGQVPTTTIAGLSSTVLNGT